MFDDGAVPCPQTPLFNDLTRQNCSPALWYYHKYPQYYYAITITIIIAYKSVDNIMSGTTILIVTMERKDANGWTMAWLPWLQARAPLLLQHLLTITLLHCYTVTLLHCYTVTLLQHLPTTNTVSIAYSREWRTIWELLKIWMYHCTIHQL